MSDFFQSYISPGLPVRTLQQMLSAIAQMDASIPRVSTDGSFGEGTLEAVMLFQRNYGLSVTGVVDYVTWNALAAANQQAQKAHTKPQSANLYPNRSYTISPGSESLYLYPIQGMFAALSQVLDNFQKAAYSGVCCPITVENTKALQACCGQINDGIFTCQLWDVLAGLYDTFVLRNPKVR